MTPELEAAIKRLKAYIQYYGCYGHDINFVVAALEAAVKDTKRLDWLETQATLAFWQGTFADNPFNIKLCRVGAPICTISTMEPDGRESNDDEIGSGDTFRVALDTAIKAKGV